MAAGELDIDSLRVQNLRGFSDATLRFDNHVNVLVGPNNSGKTSLLRLIDLCFNWDLASEFSSVSDQLLAELLPRRDTRNSVRRITIQIRVGDGRRHRKLQCKKGIALLRLSLTVSDCRLRANLGDPKRGEQHEPLAAELLYDLRSNFDFVHIPAGRSADTDQFTESLVEAISEHLFTTLRKPGKGATKVERDALDVLERIEDLSGPIDEFWTEFLERIPRGWIAGSDSSPEVDRRILARFIAEQLALSLTTGEHDADGVYPAAVGSGLQSLLDLELRRFAAESSGSKLMLATEEPEAFLHPSAQRQLARTLFSGPSRTLISTHSALIVEEAEAEQVAIVRGHEVSYSVVQEDERKQINTALLSGRGAEAIFARSVLLVEGPGDREYWEALRRRLAIFDSTGSIDSCYVLDVGGNERCAPWIRLFRSYSKSPIEWTALLDADSATELRRAASDSRARLSARQSDELERVAKAYSALNFTEVNRSAFRLSAVKDGESRLLLAPGDLESMMCANMESGTVSLISNDLGITAKNGAELAARLGTKSRVAGKAVTDSSKAPWMRGVIGRLTPQAELSQFVQRVLTLWMSGASGAPAARRAVKAFVSYTDN